MLRPPLPSGGRPDLVRLPAERLTVVVILAMVDAKGHRKEEGLLRPLRRAAVGAAVGPKEVMTVGATKVVGELGPVEGEEGALGRLPALLEIRMTPMIPRTTRDMRTSPRGLRLFPDPVLRSRTRSK